MLSTMPDPQKERGFSLVRTLYEWVREEHARHMEEERDPNIFYVTDLVYCPLKRSFRQEFPELSFTFKPIHVAGSLLHLGLASLLKDQGFEIEKSLEKAYEVGGRQVRVKGRVDAYRPDLIVEFKTGRPGQQLPHDHHALQLKAYLDLAGVEEGLLAYVTLDRMVEFRVEREEGLVERLLEQHLSRTRAPLWEWECRSCAFSEYCPLRNF